MQTRTDAVRAALAQCETWYATRGRNVRSHTERCEELWFEIDDLTAALHTSERDGNEQAANHCLNALLTRALDLLAEMRFARSRNAALRAASRTFGNPPEPGFGAFGT